MRQAQVVAEQNRAGGLREFLNSPKGSRLAIGLAVVVVLVAGYAAYRTLFVNEINELTLNDRVYICSETGKVFKVTLKLGMSTPVYSPASGKNTGYPAEFCYWTREGQIKKDPSYVLLNTYAHKSGPTVCPDCGRIVHPMNPAPQPGDPPPPLAGELKGRAAAAPR